MEIRIKTHDEARSGRVTIEINGEPTYTTDDVIAESRDREIADLRGALEQATERALMLDTALGQKQAECDRVTHNYQVLSDLNQGRGEQIEMDRQTINTLRLKVAEYDRDLKSQKKGTIEYSARADKAEAMLHKISTIIRTTDLVKGGEGSAYLRGSINDIRAVLNDESTATE